LNIRSYRGMIFLKIQELKMLNWLNL